ncbi:MAG: 2-oxoglutarate and iron-dependent oxygenase domain-containing protein [Cyanobacteria bacterium P01_H01_bin.119]
MPLPLLPLVDLPAESFDISSDSSTASTISAALTGKHGAIAQQIRAACTDWGFFYLRNHGLSADLIQSVFDQAAAFFQLPLAEKEALAWSSSSQNRGYVGLGRECLNPEQTVDSKEALNLGQEAIAPNLWPTALPNFQAVINEFYRAANQLALRVLAYLALGLELPPDFFTCHHQQRFHTLRLLHYPPAPAPGIRAGAHADYGSITLLFQHRQAGLEVQTPRGQWQSAQPIDDAVLVNIGDLLQRWTGDRYRSTLHRVVTPSQSGQASRYAIALFCEPDPETLVTALPNAQGYSYPPVRALDYLLSRLQATYG